MSGRKYYCFCDSNCKFETMTKEQILAAIAQAAETGLVFDPDAAIISRVQEGNSGRYVTFWVGTQAQYNALAEKEETCIYVITDSTKDADLVATVERAVSAAEEAVAEAANKAPYGLTEEIVEAWDEAELDTFLSRAYSEMGNNKVKFVTICPSYNIFGGIPTLAIIHKGYSNGMMSVYATATFISHGGYGGQRWYKSCENGKWSVLEWENPPMIAGVEYRTTERHNGKPVYTQLVDCDYMPNKSVKNNPDVYYGADPVENMVHKNDIVYMYAYACNDDEDGAGDFSIFPNISGGTNINADVWYDWTLGIVARTQSDMSNYKLMVVLKYTYDHY